MRRAAALLLSASLVLAACSSDDPTLDESPAATETSTSETEDPSPTASDTDTGTPTDAPTTAAPTETETGSEVGTQSDVVLTADLTGAVVVPGPGDPAGSGSFRATIVMNESSGEVCYQLEVADLSSEATAAHVHAGAEGEAGDIRVELTPPIGGPVDECVTVNATDLVPLMDDPSQFYVQVHSQGHPDGAVRGQLAAQ